MAVVTTKATGISNRDATPATPTNASIKGGALRAVSGFVGAVNGDSIGSKYIMCSVPSNARVHALHMQCAALGASATVNVGVYYPTKLPSESSATPSSAIDDDFFATLVDVSAALAATDVLNESTTNTIAKQEKELWDALGLAADPMCELDLVVTVSAAIAASGSIGLKAAYAL